MSTGKVSILKTKKKTFIIIACAVVALIIAFAIGIAFNAVPAEAEYEPVEVTEPTTNSTFSANTDVYHGSTYIQEGYSNIKDWWDALTVERDNQQAIAQSIVDEYSDYLDEAESAEILALGEKAYDAGNFTEIQIYADQLAEWQAIVDERYQEALAEIEAQQAVVYSSSTTYDSSVSSVHAANMAQAANWSGDASSAKAFIVNHESGGSYTATNGRYYGAYQLDVSYLGGDLSPENQDRVAENYVNNRYGGWEGAMSFWQSHGWY